MTKLRRLILLLLISTAGTSCASTCSSQPAADVGRASSVSPGVAQAGEDGGGGPSGTVTVMGEPELDDAGECEVFDVYSFVDGVPDELAIRWREGATLSEWVVDELDRQSRALRENDLLEVWLAFPSGIPSTDGVELRGRLTERTEACAGGERPLFVVEEVVSLYRRNPPARFDLLGAFEARRADPVEPSEARRLVRDDVVAARRGEPVLRDATIEATLFYPCDCPPWMMVEPVRTAVEADVEMRTVDEVFQKLLAEAGIENADDLSDETYERFGERAERSVYGTYHVRGHFTGDLDVWRSRDEHRHWEIVPRFHVVEQDAE